MILRCASNYEAPNSEFIQKCMFFWFIPTCLKIKIIRVLLSTSFFLTPVSLKPSKLLLVRYMWSLIMASVYYAPESHVLWTTDCSYFWLLKDFFKGNWAHWAKAILLGLCFRLVQSHETASLGRLNVNYSATGGQCLLCHAWLCASGALWPLCSLSSLHSEFTSVKTEVCGHTQSASNDWGSEDRQNYSDL